MLEGMLPLPVPTIRSAACKFDPITGIGTANHPEGRNSPPAKAKSEPAAQSQGERLALNLERAFRSFCAGDAAAPFAAAINVFANRNVVALSRHHEASGILAQKGPAERQEAPERSPTAN